MGGMSDVTLILQQIDAGQQQATEDLFPLVYQELRRLAQAKMHSERSDHTLSGTALVHEAYVRLIDVAEEPKWDGKTHFFSAAAEAMRRILVENARRRGRQKRGGDWVRVDIDAAEPESLQQSVDVLALDEALDQLTQLDPQKAQLVKLRYFTGMTIDDAAAMLGISTATAVRSWRYARAWLADKMEMDGA